MLERQSRTLRRHLVVDVFQHLDHFLRGVLLDASLLADVCAALDILILEHLRRRSFRVIGTIPQWFTLLPFDVVLEQDDL